MAKFMKKSILWKGLIFLFILIILIVIKYKSPKENQNTGREELVIYTSHPIEFISPIVAEFESRTGIRVTIVRGGTGELIERIDKEQKDTYGDVLWGGSLSTRIPHKHLFQDYYSINEDYILDEFKNKEGMLTRFTNIPSVLMVNKDLIGNTKVEGYQDLLQEDLKGKIAFCNPVISSSAYEHLINIIYAMGGTNDEDLAWDYVNLFCHNLDGNLLTSSTQVYEGVANGEYIVGLIFEEAAAALVAKGKNIQIIYMDEGVVTSPDCVSIVNNARHLENAQAFIDFVTGYDVQTMISTHLNRRSVRVDVDTPDYLLDTNKMKQINIDLNLVNKKKAEWLFKFKEIYYSINEE